MTKEEKRAYMKEWRKSPEAKASKSAYDKKIAKDPAVIAKRKEAAKAKRESPEHKAGIAKRRKDRMDATKARNLTPEYKAKKKEAHKISMLDPEKLQKRRDSANKYSNSEKGKANKNSLRKEKALTVEGRLDMTYRSMCSRVKGNSTKNPELYLGKSVCSKEDFMEWAKNDEEFNKRFEDWIESGQQYSMSPSIDRIDSEKGYDIGNMQWLTVSENGRKGAENSTRWD